MAENLFVGDDEWGALQQTSFGDALRTHDWSQTPLGAIETWSDDLKTTVQILLTELDQAQSSSKHLQDDALTLYQANQLNTFRVKLAEALRPLTDTSEVQAIAARTLGESLGANRVIYIELVSDSEEVIVHCNYTNGVTPLSGRYRLEDYGRNLTADHQAGHTQVVTNIPNHPNYTDAEKARYREINIAAHIDVPLIKNNQFVALLAAQQSTPRQWTETEIKLVEETAEQTWAAVERARVEVALRESEAKYRSLFNSMDEGYLLADILLDENDQPIDIFYLDANPAATQMVGSDYTGRRLRDIDPRYEEYWYEIFGQVVRTGKGVRMEQYAEPDEKWYSFYVFQVGGEGSCRVAVIFQDITVRKQTEERQTFSLKLSDALRSLSDPEMIRATATRILGERLAVDRVLYVEYLRKGGEDYWLIESVYHQPDYPFLDGLYPLQSFGRDSHEVLKGNLVIVNDVLNDAGILPDAKETFKATAIAAYVALPLMKDGKFVSLLTLHQATPRQWKAEEMVLLQETADRTWAAIERARAEAALRESEERFRELANDVPMFIWMADEQASVSYANKALLHFVGLEDYHEFTGKVWQSVIHPDEVEPVYEVYQTAVRDRQPYTLELRYRNAMTGTFEWHLVKGVPRYVNNQFAGMIGTGVNIHDRKLAEAIITTNLGNTRLLRDLSARFITEDNIQVLYDEVVSAAVTLTRADAGSIQALDESAQALVLIATQGLDRSITDRFQRVTASSTTSCGLVLATGKRTFVDFDVPESEDPDGSLRLYLNAGLVSAQSTPLISRSGKRVGMVSTHWRKHHRPSDRELRFLDLLARQAADLIEQRRTTAEREQLLTREQAAREEADRANQIKDEFLAVLSHELRSPLNPILGWTRLLQSGKLNADRQREALATIERNAKLQTQLIEDLLDISRIMRGKLSLEIQPVDLNKVITAALETVRLAAEAKSLHIQTQLLPIVGHVMGDAGRLQQVVWNLLSNAVKFTPQGGQVTLTLTQAGRNAQIQVTDTGKGITPDFLPSVFEHFRQEDAATTRRFGGLGLGLAIAHQIVEMHGGQICAESPGEAQGATFTVRLPLALASSQGLSSKPSSGSTSDLCGIHILVVDDEIDSREVVAFILEQIGATVTSVSSGIEALQAIEQRTPDLIISDIGMPDIDGYLLLQQIRRLESAKHIPAIALTAYAGELDRQQAIAAGFQIHLAKPIEPAEIGKIVAQLWGQTGGSKA